MYTPNTRLSDRRELYENITCDQACCAVAVVCSWSGTLSYFSLSSWRSISYPDVPVLGRVRTFHAMQCLLWGEGVV